jgi:hypothetical protein
MGWAGQGGQGNVQGQGRPYYQGQGGQGGYSGQGSVGATYTPAKVTLLRTVDHDGNVDYQTCRDAESAEKKLKDLTAEYEKAVAWRQKTEVNLTKQGLKNDRVAPVQPIVDVVKKDVAKTDASAAMKEAKDWAVYEIGIAGQTKRIVSYAYTDAFARAFAEAEFGRAYNQWVKTGKKDGEEPKPPTVTKVGAALDKADAQKALVAKTTVANAG